MLKKIPLFLLVLLLLAGCGQTPAPPEKPETPAPAAPTDAPEPAEYTFTDDLGRSVTVHGPRRTASLLGSFAQVWYLAGGTLCASADDAWADFALPMPEDAVNLGTIADLSLEKLFAAEPDFILASCNNAQQVEWLDIIEKTGIPVAYFDVPDFESYLHMLKICTEITGCGELYAENGLAVEAEIQAVIAESQARLAEKEAPTVLSMRASASSIRAKGSEGNVLGEMLRALGCVNVADGDGALLESVSMEHILEVDPDFIFFVQAGDDTEGTAENISRTFEENPAWQKLSAVREGRVYILDKALYNLKPNNRWGEAYEKLEAILAEN